MENKPIKTEHAKYEDLTGKRFGKLIATKLIVGKSKTTKWQCLCDCGEETIAGAGHLKDGHTKSCGCLRSEITSKLNKTYHWLFT